MVLKMQILDINNVLELKLQSGFKKKKLNPSVEKKNYENLI